MTKASLQDVNFCIPKVLERGEQYFRELWTSLTSNEQDVLRRIIHEEKLTKIDQKIVRQLIEKEILQQQEDLSFQVPLVKRYIEQEV